MRSGSSSATAAARSVTPAAGRTPSVSACSLERWTEGSASGERDPRGCLLRAPVRADSQRGGSRATAVLFRALGDPARVRIVNVLATSDEAVCICDLVEPLGLSQPTVSHHMKKLLDAGLVEREQRGKWAFYGLKRGGRQARSRRRSERSVLLMTTTSRAICGRRCGGATRSRPAPSPKGPAVAAASGSCCADGESDAAKFGEALYDAEQRGELPEAAALARSAAATRPRSPSSARARPCSTSARAAGST